MLLQQEILDIISAHTPKDAAWMIATMMCEREVSGLRKEWPKECGYDSNIFLECCVIRLKERYNEDWIRSFVMALETGNSVAILPDETGGPVLMPGYYQGAALVEMISNLNKSL